MHRLSRKSDTVTDRFLRLRPRLRQIADMIPNGARIVDVGTDHGYVPTWLLQQGIISTAIATDIHDEPLQHAWMTAVSCCLAEQISFRLCDGLDDVDPDEVDTVIIAGMGGETIIDILSRAEDFFTDRHRLLLQPMSKQAELRLYLAKVGWHFDEERLVRDRGELYTLMSMRFGATYAISAREAFCGVALHGDPLYGEHLRDCADKLRRVIDGLRKSGKDEHLQQAYETEKLLREITDEAERQVR